MNNKALAKILRKAIEDSEISVPVYDRINGFEIVIGYNLKHDGETLFQKISSIADLLEEVE